MTHHLAHKHTWHRYHSVCHILDKLMTHHLAHHIIFSIITLVTEHVWGIDPPTVMGPKCTSASNLYCIPKSLEVEPPEWSAEYQHVLSQITFFYCKSYENWCTVYFCIVFNSILILHLQYTNLQHRPHFNVQQ